jgi:Tfp pilus assembly protein FimT
MKNREAGLSLVESLVTLALITVTSTVALVQMRTSIVTLDADKASNLVVSQLQYARQIAVDQRRDVRVEFLSSNRIKVTRVDGGGVTTVLSDVTLPSGYVFGKPTGPGDTPEGYGNATSVCFNNDTKGTFLGDGTFVSDAGILVSGTVFTISGGNGTSRAVTLSGATGRIKTYYLQGNTWVLRG